MSLLTTRMAPLVDLFDNIYMYTMSLTTSKQARQANIRDLTRKAHKNRVFIINLQSQSGSKSNFGSRSWSRCVWLHLALPDGQCLCVWLHLASPEVSVDSTDISLINTCTQCP